MVFFASFTSALPLERYWEDFRVGEKKKRNNGGLFYFTFLLVQKSNNPRGRTFFNYFSNFLLPVQKKVAKKRTEPYKAFCAQASAIASFAVVAAFICPASLTHNPFIGK